MGLVFLSNAGVLTDRWGTRGAVQTVELNVLGPRTVDPVTRVPIADLTAGRAGGCARPFHRNARETGKVRADALGGVDAAV